MRTIFLQAIITTTTLIFPSLLKATTIPACPPGGGNVETNVENGIDVDNGDCGILDSNIGTVSGNVTINDGNLTLNGTISQITGNIEICNSCTLTINGEIGDLNGSIINEGNLIITGSLTAEGKLEVKGSGVTNLDGGSFESTGDGVVVESGARVNLFNGSTINTNSGTTNDGTITSDGLGNSFNGGVNGGGNTPSAFDGCSSNCLDDSALPVELISFKAYCSNFDISIEWITASELNNDYFVLQQSLDGKIWEDLNIIAGNGTTNRTSKYSYELTASDNQRYYRLIQTDYDGKQEIHETIGIDCGLHTGPEIYPNPSLGKISYDYPNSEIHEINVYSMDGLVVDRYKPKSDSPQSIYIQGPGGTYFIEFIRMDGEVKTVRTVKQ